MSTVLTDFLEFFGIDNIYQITTVQELLTIIFIGFIALIFTIVSIRIIFEMVKIVTDYSRWH